MKDEMRKKYINIRKNIKNKSLKDNKIYEKVIKDNDINSRDTILIYVSLPLEVDTLKIIKYFLLRKKVAVPKVEDNIINFYYINSLNNLNKGYYNILEPKSNSKVIDFTNCICITPGICFDKNNNRIGYGKGYYDKFFSKNNIFSVGLCYSDCIVDNIDTTINDKKVNKVIID